MILHTISIEKSKKYQKWRHETPKVRKSRARVSKSGPRGTKSEPKGTKSEPKGSQRWAKGRPKCIKKSTFGKGRKNDGKTVKREESRTSILEPFSMKNRWKNRCGNWDRKSKEIRRKNDAKTDLHFDDFRNCFSWKIEFFEKGACTKTIWILE